MPIGVLIPDSIRWTVIRMGSCSFSPQEIYAFTNVSPRQQRRIMKVWNENKDVVRPQNDHRLKGRPRHLNAVEIAFLQGRVNETCDTYLDELRGDLLAVCGTEVSNSTIWRSLHRCGYKMKKLSRRAMERSIRKRAAFTFRMGSVYTSDQLVFVDESAVDRRTTYRGYAWALRGQRASRKAFFVRGRRYSILPAIALNGILTVDIVEGSYDKLRFARFIDGLLDQMNPYPAPNSVIVMDNCRIHKCEEVLDMIEERGMRYEFLPPYSPDFNPIELAFSAIKAFIRRNGKNIRTAMGESDDTDVYLHLNEAVWTVTEEDARGWFKHAGYE